MSGPKGSMGSGGNVGSGVGPESPGTGGRGSVGLVGGDSGTFEPGHGGQKNAAAGAAQYNRATKHQRNRRWASLRVPSGNRIGITLLCQAGVGGARPGTGTRTCREGELRAGEWSRTARRVGMTGRNIR